MASDNSKEDELAGTEQPFVAHLVELRDRLVKAAIAVGIAVAILPSTPVRPRFTTCWRSRWCNPCPRAPP